MDYTALICRIYPTTRQHKPRDWCYWTTHEAVALSFGRWVA